MSTSLTTSQSTSLELSQAQPLDRNPAAVYLGKLRPGARRTMAGALNTMARMLGTPPAYIAEEPSEDRRRRERREVTYLMCSWQDLRFQHTQALRSQLADQYAASTANKMLSALRQVLKRCWRLGLMSQEDYARAADIEAIDGSSLLAGRGLSAGEMKALFDTLANDDAVIAARDAAIIAVAYTCGLRRAELCGLDLADYDEEAGELKVLHAKRNKPRLMPVINGAAEAIADWLVVRGTDDGPLFVPIRKGGEILLGERLTEEAIWHMMVRRAAEAGVAHFSPHDLRRSYISDLLDAGADLALVSKLAGHANVATTAKYDRRPEAAKRKAAELLMVPYRRRRMV